MRSTSLAEGRADLSKLGSLALGDLALGGEPQRVTRRGREAVVIVSAAERRDDRASRPEPKLSNLGEVRADFAECPDA